MVSDIEKSLQSLLNIWDSEKDLTVEQMSNHLKFLNQYIDGEIDFSALESSFQN